jgi:hypothetical protein
MPHEMIEYGSSAERRGLRVIIAGAGGAAHLPGMLASVTPLPVIGGHGASEVNEFRYRNILYFSWAESTVVGSYSEKDKAHGSASMATALMLSHHAFRRDLFSLVRPLHGAGRLQGAADRAARPVPGAGRAGITRTRRRLRWWAARGAHGQPTA